MSIEIEYSDTPVWQPQSALDLLREETMARGSRIILDNFDLKYIDARIDMRSGAVLLKEGNCIDTKARYLVVSKTGDGG